ncbi:MAG: hypothetical protein GKR91_00845 [Pseudomonadales bacterium]|nr:hypothetical protein [Pseudomonadales bacterium]
MQNTRLRNFSYTAVLLFLIACGPLTEIAALSDSELRSEMAQCHAIPNPSNSKAIACQNFTRECEKRVKKDGKYRNC